MYELTTYIDSKADNCIFYHIFYGWKNMGNITIEDLFIKKLSVGIHERVLLPLLGHAVMEQAGS